MQHLLNPDSNFFKDPDIRKQTRLRTKLEYTGLIELENLIILNFRDYYSVCLLP